jgi:hypothetical protein
MSKSLIHTKVIHKGERPPCLKSQQQCRGCFGWRDMLNAAKTDIFWQSYPFRCALTGLTLKVEGINKLGGGIINGQIFRT